MPECLKCGCELEFDGYYYTEFDGDTILAHVLGYCPKCGAYHTWEEVFNFEKFQNVKID